ncbi:amino acid permease [Limosilactobacillus antri]|uniref:amino acid permease n=1 Tax=Limosilactobacillus antri TaxID=227943 RepID=UPI001F5990AE|nr:amino acid permease [Limosilactobacillus antri]
MNKQQGMKRSLKSRHIQLMALGGTIGTGLFLGSGKAIRMAGPAILLAYLITGMICFGIMRALGELLMANLKYRSFMEAIRDYLGRRVSFITGWAYWACWLALAMAEITAIGLYIQIWLPELPQWVPGLITLLIFLCLNLITVNVFGEIEFWFALIKIIAILVLIAVGIFMMVIQFRSRGGYVASPANLFAYNGFFATGWKGFVMSFQMVVFAFVGIEMVGVTAAEAENPRQVIPKAINGIPIRILLFYIGALAVIMCIYPWNRLSPTNSPFVLVFRDAGLRGAASLVNFVVITAAASACNSSLYTTGRMLAELTSNAHRPAIRRLSHLSKNQVPARAVAVSAAVIGLAAILNLTMPGEVFTLVSSIATTSFLFIWAAIIGAHLRFIKLHPTDRRFKMPGAPVTDWLVLLFLAFVMVVLCFEKQTLIALLLTLIWFTVLGVASLSQPSRTKND